MYKTDFSFESYLKYVRDFKLRRCISQLRLSSHQLQVEKGRHIKPKIPLENRLCKLCDLNVIEDEIHFLIECPFYLDERVHFLAKLLCSQRCFFDDINVGSNRDVFTCILSLNDEYSLFCLARFIQNCF